MGLVVTRGAGLGWGAWAERLLWKNERTWLMGWFGRFVASLRTVRTSFVRSATLVRRAGGLRSTRRRFLGTSVSPIALSFRRSQPLNFSAEAVYLSCRVTEIRSQLRGELVESAGQFLDHLPCPVRFHWHSLCIESGLV